MTRLHFGLRATNESRGNTNILGRLTYTHLKFVSVVFQVIKCYLFCHRGLILNAVEVHILETVAFHLLVYLFGK